MIPNEDLVKDEKYMLTLTTLKGNEKVENEGLRWPK